MTVLIRIIQLIIALAVLILVHELGHFTFAKIFKIRVDKFYLFFDAGGFSLFKFKPKGSETEYGIGWLPLGGYCKIAGMIDESMDTEHLKSEAQPWEFRSKPAWQRLLVMAGGVIFNFILAIITYSFILSHWGETYVSNEDSQIYVNGLAYEMGFRNGDRIIRFDDYQPTDFYMLQADMARQKAGKATVVRGEDTLDIYIDQRMIGKVLNSPGMFSLAVPFVVKSIGEDSPNFGKGLADGDRILTVGGTAIEYVQDAWPVLESHAGELMECSIKRGADTLSIPLQVDSAGRLGVYISVKEPVKKEYSFLSAIPAGCRKTFSSIGDYLMDLRLVATPSTEAYKSVGSFIAIGKIFPTRWNWQMFLNIIAMLSVMLGVMNLLPVPALDGGHIIFTLYEMVTGRKPSDNFLYAAQIVGMLLIFGLMFLAFGNDIVGLFR